MIEQAAPYAMLVLGLYLGFMLGVLTGVWRGTRRRRRLEALVQDLEYALGGGDRP